MTDGTKYGHLGQIDPAFAPMEEASRKNFEALWALPLDQLLQTGRGMPPSLLEDSPTEDDIDISHQLAPASDGTQLDLRIYKSKDFKPNGPLFLVAHGGGWVIGGHGIEEAMNRHVARYTSALVVSVDYRMAPEHKFPYAVNDCFDMLKWCKSNATSLGIDPGKIVVGGGSAGGNIAAVLSQMARDKGVSGVVGQVLNIPVTCHPKHFPRDRFEYTSWEQNKNAPVLAAKNMMWFWDQYLPGQETEVYASPLLAASLKSLPPALIQVAGLDPLRDEGLAYAEALKEAGVPVSLKVYPGLPHGFSFLIELKATHEYVTNVVDWINAL